MNQQRFQELARKRDGEGLSDEEADELGRLIAMREGKPYGKASDQDREAGVEERSGQRSS